VVCTYWTACLPRRHIPLRVVKARHDQRPALYQCVLAEGY